MLLFLRARLACHAPPYLNSFSLVHFYPSARPLQTTNKALQRNTITVNWPSSSVM